MLPRPEQILQAVPLATLWLLAWPGIEPHVRREARARGLSDGRVVFTPLLPAETHIRWKVKAARGAAGPREGARTRRVREGRAWRAQRAVHA